MDPQTSLPTARRVVVKLGTAVVTREGESLALGRLCSLIESMARMQLAGRQIILISSGAVSMGQQVLGLPERPRSLGMRQACAAVGQGQLHSLYTQAFSQFGVKVAQVLLTQEDLNNRDRLLCLRTTLLRLIELNVVPILNENDSVSVRELIEVPAFDGGNLAFGDNDGLSARVAIGVDAELLVLLTDVDGVYTANPNTDPDARRIAVIDDLGAHTLGLASGQSKTGTGGMLSKLRAAQEATQAGISVLIGSGHQPGVLDQIFTGEPPGTFVPATRRRQAHRQAIVTPQPAGALVVNAGGLRALATAKASLLPVGIERVEGHFGAGDVVEIRDASGRVHGRGLVNYDDVSCRAIAGRQSSEIAEVLGWRGYSTVIGRDNLVMSQC